MKRRNLARVDDALAVKPKLADKAGFLDEAFLVVDVAVHGVNCINAGCARCVEDHAACKEQLGAVAANGFEVRHIVLCAKGNADEALGGKSDFHRIEHAAAAFNRSHHARGAHRDTRFALDAFNFAFTVNHILRTLGFGQADDIGLRANNRLKVLNSQAGRKVVDAHNKFLVAVFQVGKSIINEEARRILFIDGNGVLQIEHDGIRAVDVRVADHAGVVARDKQHAAS